MGEEGLFLKAASIPARARGLLFRVLGGSWQTDRGAWVHTLESSPLQRSRVLGGDAAFRKDLPHPLKTEGLRKESIFD